MTLLSALDPGTIDWSRAQFALTACVHWLFVPLTLGLGLIVAILETIYYRKKDEAWKAITKFWMKLFGINFAIGVATGIILEFEFGTNWSNYSWFVGDIFGAPLAIEGIVAFFMEATFFAVMFFGWEKVSRKFHLASTWLTIIGASLSAWWILVANAWMQHPVGMEFNPETVRNEMTSFLAVAFSPTAVVKFFHAVSSGWMTGAVFVTGISCWFLLKKRNITMALRSGKVASITGIVATLIVLGTGDQTGIKVAKEQPMKLAAAEGLRQGGPQAPFSIIPGIEVPGALSFLATHSFDGFVPGIDDMLNGYTDAEGQAHLSADEKMARGKLALEAFADFREAYKTDPAATAEARERLNENVEYFGYGYIAQKEDLVPSVPIIYWAFRVMAFFGCFLFLVLLLVAWTEYKDKLQNFKLLHILALIAIPMVFLCGQAGWIVAEVGRQPWAIQDLLPVNAAVSQLTPAQIITTFIIFIIVFAVLLTAEIKIMCKAIKNYTA